MTSTVFITHESALALQREAQIANAPFAKERTSALPAKTPTKCELEQARRTIVALFPNLRQEQTFHIATGNGHCKATHSSFCAHSLLGALPRNSTQNVAPGISVASVPLAFFQYAQGKTPVEIMLKALELCGSYCVLSDGSVAYDTKALTCIDELRKFADNAPDFYGKAKALQALEHVRDGSASPRESQLFLALCLPMSKGGYGIAPATFNHKVTCTEKAREISGRSNLRCDLCWPDALLDVEYQSDENHSGADRLARDSRRANGLIAMGFTVLNVTNKELETMADLDVIADNIKAKLGIRPRCFTSNHYEKKLKLRRELGLPVRFG